MQYYVPLLLWFMLSIAFFLSMSTRMMTMSRNRDISDMTTAMTSPMTRPMLMLIGEGDGEGEGEGDSMIVDIMLADMLGRICLSVGCIDLAFGDAATLRYFSIEIGVIVTLVTYNSMQRQTETTELKQ